MTEQNLPHSFKWLGDTGANAYLDSPHIERCADVIIGCYGGATQGGAFKNEDAAFVLCSTRGDWRFAALVDGHYSTQSDELIFATLDGLREMIIEAMQLPAGQAFETLRSLLTGAFGSKAFRDACRGVIGEASAIFCAQKGRFLFWLSVGDCLAFVFHPELGGLGQFALNQRKYFEWLGKSNAFDLEAPPFSSGVQELRQGVNSIVLASDGLYEYPGSPFENAVAIYHLIGPDQPDLASGVRRALETVHEGRGRDSATLIAWQVAVKERPTYSSPMPG